jgi:hypothetical protein
MMGLLNYDLTEYPINKLENNTNNITRLEGQYVTKIGNKKFLEGEIYFYQNIPRDKKIISFFPQFIKSEIISDTLTKLYIENIDSIPFYTLYQHKMITENHLKKLFDMVKILHACNGPIIISDNDIKCNYTDKLKERFKKKEDYPFSDAEDIQKICLNNLNKYYDSPFEKVYIIHGDLWFSNILVQFNGNIKFIDMKGKIDKIFTTNAIASKFLWMSLTGNLLFSL